MIAILKILPYTIFYIPLILLLFSTLSIAIYFLIWNKIGNHVQSNFKIHNTEIIENKSLQITVIIPFRNEAHRIIHILNSIQKIDFEGQIEFLFIDDHSNDNSSSIIINHPIYEKYNIKIVQLPDYLSGKKDAIMHAISIASNETIVTTDADCEFQPATLSALVSSFISQDANLGIGPVFFKSKQISAVQVYQKIENTALIALGYYLFSKNKPTMANGANLIYKKSIFQKLNPFQNNRNVAGGDDIFTLEAFYKFDPKKVIAITNPDAGIYTDVLRKLNELWLQRIRWVKKTSFQSTTNTEKSQKLLAIFFVLFWGFTILSLYYSCYEIVLLLWIGKIIADTIILKKIFRSFAQQIFIYEIVLASVYQNIFIPILGISHPFSKTVWKQRIYS